MRHPFRGPSIRFIVVTVLYLTLRAVFFEFAALFEIGSNASAWYPPTGLSFAFVAITGWAGVPFAFIPSSLLATGTITPYSAIVIPQAIVMSAAALIWRRRWGNFVSVSSTTSFILIGLTATIVLSLGSAWVIAAITPAYDNLLDHAYFGFWLGDASGVLVCAPFFFCLFSKILSCDERQPVNWRMLQPRTATYALGSAIVALALWRASVVVTATPVSAFFLLILPIAVLANRYGFGAAVISAFVTNFGLVAMAHSLVPATALMDLQLFMLTAGLTGLLLGAMGSNAKDIDDTNQVLVRDNEHLAQALAATSVGVALVDMRAGMSSITFSNSAFSNYTAAFEQLKHDGALLHGFDGDKECTATGRISNWLIKPALSSETAKTLIVIARDVTELRRQQLVAHHQSRLAAVGKLAGGIAHEINNLLHPILNLSRFARRSLQSGNEQTEEAFVVIERSAIKAAAVVRQVLEFSRQATPQASCIDLITAIPDALTLIKASIPPSFSVDVLNNSAVLPVNMAPSEVTQIVANIVINAVHATGGRGTMTICTKETSDYFIEISFKDDGPGVDSAISCEIFDAFFTTKSHGDGTGLGLAIVKEIILAREGNITLETFSPRGAQFVVRIPRSKEEV